MSVQATSWVWDHSQAEGNARLVLLAIADGANKQGGRSCQSAKTIGEMCRLSSRSVQRHIALLLESGELVIEGTHGKYHTNIYALPGLSRYDSTDVRQNDVYDSRGSSLRQNEPVATTELCHPTPIPQDTYVSTPERDADKSAPSKGSRMVDGWMPDQKHIDKIKQMRPDIDLNLEHTKFMNYWIAKTGKDASKKDWGRTWENWMLNARVDKSRQEYKPGWQKRLEHAAKQNEQYKAPSNDGVFSIGR